MKILIDMNLSPSWVQIFERENWQSHHWSTIGSPTATDVEILEWARNNACIILTHDLDFGALLAYKRGTAPSVVQLRGQETSPARLGATVVLAIRQLSAELVQGALVSIDPVRTRARILPLR